MSKKTKVAPEHKLVLTSVKAHPHILKRFQEDALHMFNLQKLVNRAMYLYVQNEDFKKLIQNCNDLATTGSL